MSFFGGPSSGNSAEDKMSQAAGCVSCAVICGIAAAGVCAGLIIHWMLG